MNRLPESPLPSEEHVAKSSIKILGHWASEITHQHYAHRDPLALKANLTIPQPTAFSALIKGFAGVCPFCRWQFADA